MRLRTRLNLVVAGLSATFLIVLIAAEVQSTRASVREEIEAANRVASQLLGQLASIYSNVGGPDLADQVAAVADLVAGQAAEGRPLVLVRGLRFDPVDQGAGALLRKPEEDLYA